MISVRYEIDILLAPNDRAQWRVFAKERLSGLPHHEQIEITEVVIGRMVRHQTFDSLMPSGMHFYRCEPAWMVATSEL